jgi:hypothetical protein
MMFGFGHNVVLLRLAGGWQHFLMFGLDFGWPLQYCCTYWFGHTVTHLLLAGGWQHFLMLGLVTWCIMLIGWRQTTETPLVFCFVTARLHADWLPIEDDGDWSAVGSCSNAKQCSSSFT